MIGRRAIIGLALLSALLLCAFTAQSASAAKAVNTTGVTCVEVAAGTGDFTDAHCDISGKGNFAHKAIANDLTTEGKATNQGVTESTKKSEPAVLKSKVGLTATEITCNTAEAEPKNSLGHNIETEGKHTITGTGRGIAKTCTVNKPAKCTVKEPIEGNGTGFAVEGLGAGANEMGAELVGSGAEETFTEITFEGAECALKAKTFKVKGSVIVTSGPTTESSQTNKWTGATAVLTPKNGMEKLKLGVETAEVTGIGTATGPSGAPFAATTVT
jgi:hypothetical protein